MTRGLGVGRWPGVLDQQVVRSIPAPPGPRSCPLARRLRHLAGEEASFVRLDFPPPRKDQNIHWSAIDVDSEGRCAGAAILSRNVALAGAGSGTGRWGFRRRVCARRRDRLVRRRRSPVLRRWSLASSRASAIGRPPSHR